MKKSGVTPPGPLLITGCVRPGAIVDISATEASASPMLIIIIYCSRTLRYERTQISNQISETEPRSKNGTSRVRVVFEKTGCEMGEPEAPAPRGAADVYFLLVAASNLVTALVPSETACLAS